MLFLFLQRKMGGKSSRKDKRDNRRKFKERESLCMSVCGGGGRARDEGMNKQTQGGGTEVLFLSGAAGVPQSFELGAPLEAR